MRAGAESDEAYDTTAADDTSADGYKNEKKSRRVDIFRMRLLYFLRCSIHIKLITYRRVCVDKKDKLLMHKKIATC